MLNQLLNLIWLSERDGGGAQKSIFVVNVSKEGAEFRPSARAFLAFTLKEQRQGKIHTPCPSFDGPSLEPVSLPLGHTRGCWDVWSLELNPMLLLKKQLFSFPNKAPSLFPSLLKSWASHARMELCEGLFDRPHQGSLEAFQQLSVPQVEQQHWTGVLLPLSLELNPRWKPITFCGYSLNANTWSHCLSWRCHVWGMTKYCFCFKPHLASGAQQAFRENGNVEGTCRGDNP